MIDDAPARQARHAAEALELEEDTAAQVTSTFRNRLTDAAGTVLAAFLRGKIGAVLAKVARGKFLNIRPGLRHRMAKAIPGAVALGVRQGLDLVVGTAPTPGAPRPDHVLNGVLGQMDAAAVARLSDAADLAGKLPLTDAQQVAVILGKANTAVTGADATARWLTNRAVSAGTAAVAKAAGARLVWVCERNACLHCLAYAGWVVEPGQSFPEGLTYADKPLKPYGDLIYPPLHPNCRCQVDVTYLPVGRSDLDLAREAERSVARGLTDFHSTPESLRAADRLVQHPTLLPKSVVARARRNVADGKFKDRPHNRHRPTPITPEPVHREPRAELADIAKAPNKTVTPVLGGISNTTELVTLPDGRKAIHKTIGHGTEPEDNVFLMDGEQLASILADALGAPIARVYRDAPGSVWVEFVGGTTEGVDALKDSKEGVLIRLLDILTQYRDRESGLRVVDGKLAGFDSGGSWLEAVLHGPVPDDPQLGDLPLTKAELQALRARMVKTKGAFARAGRAEWLEFSLAIMDQLIKRKS